MNKIKNRAAVEINLCGRMHVVESIETVVEPIKVEIEQEQPCPFVLENDTFRYVFKIKNLSEANISNVRFKDILSNRVEFVCGSFEVNGCREHADVHGNVLEHIIRELHACDTVIISFAVKAREMENPCGNGNGNGNGSCCGSNFIHAGQI
jgi:uncharacterized repeat protein (TIGR01451 family)